MVVWLPLVGLKARRKSASMWSEVSYCQLTPESLEKMRSLSANLLHPHQYCKYHLGLKNQVELLILNSNQGVLG